jgi:hypothetical protein
MMASWVSVAPEAWFGLALLLAIIAAIAGVTLGRSANPRMEFFLSLMSDFPAGDNNGAVFLTRLDKGIR